MADIALHHDFHPDSYDLDAMRFAGIEPSELLFAETEEDAARLGPFRLHHSEALRERLGESAWTAFVEARTTELERRDAIIAEHRAAWRAARAGAVRTPDEPIF